MEVEQAPIVAPPPPQPRKNLPIGDTAAAAFVAIAVALCLFQLYTSIRPVGLFHHRGYHLGLVQVLGFLLFPVWKRGKGEDRGLLAWGIDGALIAASVFTALYLTINLDAIVSRPGNWTNMDLIVGVVAVLTLMEAVRRVIGLPIVAVALVFIAYAYAGPNLPGVLRHGGYSTRRLVGQLYLGQEGIYGLPLGVAATFVFIFILFGALLEVTGAGRFFIDLAYAATGRQRGGPAKAAVVASATLGSMSGSAVANVVTTGVFTIPLMRRVGYKAEEAAGIEAAASTGGAILPPIMGAGAFLMAEYTGLPYLEIARAALIPAMLYFVVIFLFVHLLAVRRNMRGLPASELPRFGPTLSGGWHYLLAIAVLIGGLFQDLSVFRVGFYACSAIVLLAAARAMVDRVGASRSVSRSGPPAPDAAPPIPLTSWASIGGGRILDAFVLAGRNTLTVSLACAVAGIMVGIVGLTGLGLKFSVLMLSFSQGSLLLALFLVAFTSLILGIGLPVTASYIVLIVIAGPTLVNEFGLAVLVAHMVVFWFSQDSNVTPPVPLAAFAAAGIAGSKPMLTGLYAWKYAKGLYIIPLFMVAHPEIVLGGPWSVVLTKTAITLVGLVAFAMALDGHALRPLGVVSRLILVACLLAAFHPSVAVGGLAGLVVVAVVMLGGKPLLERRTPAATV